MLVVVIEETMLLFAKLEMFTSVFGEGPLRVDLTEDFREKDCSDTLFFSILSLMERTDGEAATAGGCTLGRRGCLEKFILQQRYRIRNKKKRATEWARMGGSSVIKRPDLEEGKETEEEKNSPS